jgi:hypothetical protein
MRFSWQVYSGAAVMLLVLGACSDAGGVSADRTERASLTTATTQIVTTTTAAEAHSFGESGDTSELPQSATTTTTSRSRPESENGATVIDDIQLFWARSASEFELTEFEALPPDRIVAIDTAEPTGVFCDNEELFGDEVFDNAFASVCDEGYLVAYDQTGLMRQLTEDIGPVGPAIVLAHEWGHIAQFQAHVLVSPVIAEQQADCLSGAWAADAFERGYAPMDSPAALDDGVRASLANADEPGESAFDVDAHGTGFDRVRAFQEGFEQGVAFCGSYAVTPPSLFQVPFAPGLETQTEGNLPIADLLELTADDLAAYFTEVAGTDPALVPEDIYSAAELQQIYSQLGDNGLLTALAMAWGRSGESSVPELLQRSCLVGGWMQLHLDPPELETVSLSSGDLDEAIATLVQLSVDDRAASEPGLLFETVAAMRIGVFGGADACVPNA